MILQILDKLAQYLAMDGLTLLSIVDHLGTIQETYAGSIHIEPYDDAFSFASVVRVADTDRPAHVRLELRIQLSLAELEAKFGDYRQIDVPHGEPDTLIFHLDTGDTPFAIVMLAEINNQTVTAITLRRDKRLSL